MFVASMHAPVAAACARSLGAAFHSKHTSKTGIGKFVRVTKNGRVVGVGRDWKRAAPNAPLTKDLTLLLEPEVTAFSTRSADHSDLPSGRTRGLIRGSCGTFWGSRCWESSCQGWGGRQAP